MSTDNASFVKRPLQSYADSSSDSRSIRDFLTSRASSERQASPATSFGGTDNPEYPEPNSTAESAASDEGGEASVSVVPHSKMKGFVLFAVDGAKRLQSGRLRLSHVNVGIHADDDSFFRQMAVQYKLLRGFFRWHFSIWKFQACKFVMVCQSPLKRIRLI